jgi:hypothetical protein
MSTWLVRLHIIAMLCLTCRVAAARGLLLVHRCPSTSG